MDNYRTVVIALILVSLLSFPARAQGIPGRWEKVEALKLGSPITVELKNGDRLGGQFEGLSPSELLLRTNSAQAAIPRSDIQRITTRQHDSVKNGTLIGAGVGAVIGLGVVVARSGFGGGDRAWLAYALGLSLFGAGVGALGGLGVDAGSWKNVVLYQAR